MRPPGPPSQGDDVTGNTSESPIFRHANVRLVTTNAHNLYVLIAHQEWWGKQGKTLVLHYKAYLLLQGGDSVNSAPRLKEKDM